MSDWHEEIIKAELRKRGVTLTRVASELSVTPAAISIAIRCRSSASIEDKIAEILDCSPSEIWPSRYRRDGERIILRTPKSQAAKNRVAA